LPTVVGEPAGSSKLNTTHGPDQGGNSTAPELLWNENMAGAEKEFKRAIELYPNYPTAHHWYGNYLTDVGRDSEAMIELNRALELDAHYYYRRDYDGAIAQMQKAVEIGSKLHQWSRDTGVSLFKKRFI